MHEHGLERNVEKQEHDFLNGATGSFSLKMVRQ